MKQHTTNLCCLGSVLLAGSFAAGCAPASATRTVPPDFSVRYEWREGSLPPPYHYEYSMHIGPKAQGRMMMVAGYSGSSDGSVPMWTEKFKLKEADLVKLYKLMAAKDVFTRRWKTSGNSPVGGSRQWLQGSAHGQKFAIPNFLPNKADKSDADAIYAAIKALVPAAIGKKLHAKRDKFAEDYRKKNGR